MKQKLRQPLSILLTLLMLLALLPAAAFAADGGDGTENPYAHTDHTGYTEWTNTGALPDEEGEYYLSNDITLSANWDVPGETVLCLNGHNINLSAYHFEVGKSEHLVICDCSTTEHQGYLNPERYYLWTHETGEGEVCNLIGGVIYGGVSSQGLIGSCIHADGGDVTLAGGNIAGNLHVNESNLNESNMNGAVYISNGDFTMYDGSITGNYSRSQGGGVHVTGAKQSNKSQIKLYGGEISHNIADYFAGGIYIAGGYNTATISSGRVCYNTCKGSGAGLYLSGSSYADREFFKMTGGLIKGDSVDNAYVPPPGAQS